MGESVNCSATKRVLKNLCVTNGWSYGVFWRFDLGNPMLLTLEDAYYEERTGSAIENLLLKVHMLGEGAIGLAALNGKHQWILADGCCGERNSFRSSDSKDTFPVDSEVFTQFSSGIKTTVVIPVEPHGVVQFGSTEKIAERLEFVDQTIRVFQEIHNFNAHEPLENLHSSEKVGTYDISMLFASSLPWQNSNSKIVPLSDNNYNEIRGNNCSSMNSNQSSLSTEVHVRKTAFSSANTAFLGPNSSHFEKSFQQSNCFTKSCFAERPSCLNVRGHEFPPVLASSNQNLGVDSQFFQDSLDAIYSKGNSFEGNAQGDATFSYICDTGSLTETEFYFQAGSGNVMDSQISVPAAFEGLLDDFKLDDFATNMLNLCQEDDLSQWLVSSPDQSINQMANALSGDFTHLFESTSTSCLAESNIAFNDSTNLVKEKSIVVQSSEKDMSDGKKLNGKCGKIGESWEDIMIPRANGNYPTTSSASLKCASSLNSTFVSGPRKGLFSELGLEELLAGTNSSSCLTSSNIEDLSCSAKRRRIESASSSGNASMLHYNTEKSRNLETKKELPKSQVGLWIDDSNSITPSSTVLSSQQQKSEEQKRVVRKRARPGESTRPRPKDRQLIQDRIKDLRGIIPNSGKCSIDSLLERTIKYTVFLQGVTKHGDKLKQPTTPKLIGSEKGGVPRDKNNMSGGGGATWAYEVGGQSTVCPIIVEDLSPPGQMLIEMLCEEQGFFLEIADIIRGFGLSILKGIMEIREDKIWAHFIVEAKSHTSRIDVFWSLVRLLQRTQTSTINSDKQPSNAVLDSGISPMESYHKPNLLPPICLAETLH